MNTRRILLLLVAVAASLLLPPSIQAQSSDGSISGIVLGDQGQPLAGVLVRARNTSTGFSAQALSGPNGRYFFLQLPLGGPYTLEAQMLGYAGEIREGYQLNLGDQIRADFNLRVSAVAMDEIRVSVESSSPRTGAGLVVGRSELEDIPAADRNFRNLALLSPVSGAGLTIGGQRGTATGMEIDGLNARNNRQGRDKAAGPMAMSMEVVREFQVSTNDFDVTQGRQGGGAIRVATRSGTNELEGSVFATHLNEQLTTEDFLGRPPSQFDRSFYGFSLGGPIIRDRLHFFTVVERRSETTPASLFQIRGPDDEVALRISADSINRMLDILRTNYGTGNETQTGGFSAANTGTSVFSKVDWQIRDGQRLTWTTNYARSLGDPYQGPGPGIFEAKGFSDDRGLTTSLALRSDVAPGVVNEASFQYMQHVEERIPNSGFLPLGLVRIRSNLPNGTLGNVLVQFGGNRNYPAEFPEKQFQLTNRTFLQRGDNQFTFGIDNLVTLYRNQYVSQEQLGRFDFNSLADLEAMRPSRFLRQVPLRTERPAGRQTIADLALYGQVVTRPNPRLTLQGGLRYDLTVFGDRPDYNPIVEEVFGKRNDDGAPLDWTRIQPRARLTWNRLGDAREAITIGAGIFSAQPVHTPFYNSILFNGLELAQISVTGAAVAAPEFVRYRQDPGTIPGLPEGAVLPPGVVNMISQDFRMPRLFKASVEFQKEITPWARLGATAIYAHGWNNYQFVDINLNQDGLFQIEGGRGVLAPAGSIGANGQVSVANARVTDRLGMVAELRSPGQTRQKALVLDGRFALPRDAALTLSYTLNETRDNANWNCCLVPAGLNQPVTDHPKDLAWGASDWDFRHKAVVFGSLPSLLGIRVSGSYVAQSGTPFSLVANQDINGDGSANNDLAFVFDPADPSTPPAIAEAMQRVLDNPENLARDYIRANLGQIAERNGGRAPWSGRLDIRATRGFPTFGGHRAEITADVFNFLNLLNSEWGGRKNLGVRQTLLQVESFDPATQRFNYAVNENVGVTRTTGNPYQIQLSVRYLF